MKTSNNVPVRIYSISDNGFGVEGVVCENGHWQKFPTGIKFNWDDSFIKFWQAVCDGKRYIHCKRCNNVHVND